mgnify:CR=1 FL=1
MHHVFIHAQCGVVVHLNRLINRQKHWRSICLGSQNLASRSVWISGPSRLICSLLLMGFFGSFFAVLARRKCLLGLGWRGNERAAFFRPLICFGVHMNQNTGHAPNRIRPLSDKLPTCDLKRTEYTIGNSHRFFKVPVSRWPTNSWPANGFDYIRWRYNLCVGQFAVNQASVQFLPVLLLALSRSPA